MFADGGFENVEIAGYQLEMVRKGSGRPLLYLHGGHGFASDSAFLDILASRFEVFAPSHPGFGASPTIDHLGTVGDLGFYYLDLLDGLRLDDVVVVGASLGGWIALDMAVKNTARIGNLVLLGAAGVKFNDREHRQFADPFLMDDPDMPSLYFHDEAAGLAAFGDFDFKGMGEGTAMRFARNAEAFMRFGWSPLLHNPALRNWLHRIDVPAEAIWGAHDRIAPPDYGRQLAGAIPGARYCEIAGAGHYVDVEKPEETGRAVIAAADARIAERGTI